MESEVIDVEIHQKVGILIMNNPSANTFKKNLQTPWFMGN